MPSQRYEYRTEAISVTPTELRSDTVKIDRTLADFADEGWELDATIGVDTSSLLFVFRRPVDTE